MTTLELTGQAGQVSPEVHYSSGERIVSRRIDAIVQSKLNSRADIEILEQVPRCAITGDDVADIYEDAALFGHGRQISSEEIRDITKAYMEGDPEEGIKPILGVNAPCTLDNLHALIKNALIHTDPDPARRKTMRDVYGADVLSFAKNDLKGELLEEHSALLHRSFTTVSAMKFVPPTGEKLSTKQLKELEDEFNTDKFTRMALITADAMKRGLLRDEIREIREAAIHSVQLATTQ